MRRVAALVLACGVFGLLVACGGGGKTPPTAATAKQESTVPPISRAEFVGKVKGKTADEIVAAVGKPDRTGTEEIVRGKMTFQGRELAEDFKPLEKVFYYKRRTFDEITGKIDENTDVVFYGSTADQVRFPVSK